MKPLEPPLPALFLLLLAACEPLPPTDEPAPTQPPGTTVPSAMAADTSVGEPLAMDASAAPASSAPDAALSADAAAPDASAADAAASDASQRVDAQTSEAGIGCCPVGGPCGISNTKIVARSGCGLPPVPPIPPTPPAICLSNTTAVPGYCGSYACKQTPSNFAAAFNAAGSCANARDFMCAGTMQGIAYQCMIDNALVVKSVEASTLCIKSNPSVAANHVGDACVACFVTAYECCKKNEQCLAACVQGTGKACDDAQRAAGCVAPLVACAGLPSPF